MTTALAPRSAEYRRSSAETTIELQLTLDGSGKTSIETGFGMLDHMLTLMAFWADMDLRLVPMDEALADVTVDLSGRPWLEWRGDDLLPPVIAGEEKDLWREFYKALASGARCNAHICFHYGKNGHHLLESAAKGMGLALAQAVCRRGSAIRSTKGGLD